MYADFFKVLTIKNQIGETKARFLHFVFASIKVLKLLKQIEATAKQGKRVFFLNLSTCFYCKSQIGETGHI